MVTTGLLLTRSAGTRPRIKLFRFRMGKPSRLDTRTRLVWIRVQGWWQWRRFLDRRSRWAFFLLPPITRTNSITILWWLMIWEPKSTIQSGRPGVTTSVLILTLRLLPWRLRELESLQKLQRLEKAAKVSSIPHDLTWTLHGAGLGCSIDKRPLQFLQPSHLHSSSRCRVTLSLVGRKFALLDGLIPRDFRPALDLVCIA